MSAPTTDTVTPFDVLGPLPTGTTVLEASAGTGKTYTIAALAARYVAEAGVPLAELMLVTFGREATRELRERVRERLVAVERALAEGDPGTDAVTDSIVAVDDAERAVRRRRLAHALAHFDEATIATTHQFCQDMLAGLGVAGDTDADARFVEQIDDVVTEVVDDFYVRAYAPDQAPTPPFDRATALALGRAAVGDPTAVIAPAKGATTGDADARSRFAVAVRDEVDRRKRTRRLFTFDDMLTRLHAALVDPRLGAAACDRLRARYRVVLVDEFQDTDPIQWDILRVAFHGHSTLTVIGDPKQAIYAFRGADVVSYLAAAGSAGARATLGTNHRSDAGLLAALDTVFGGAALGDERIVVHPVGAAHPGSRLAGAPDATPFRLRVVPRKGLRANFRTGLPEIGPARARVAEDLTADVSGLLAADSTWDGAPLGPGDVAVLVRTNAQADLVRDALATAGVPAVLAGAASVFATEAAREWLTLLEAIEQPGRVTRVRAAALTCFVGKRAEELDADPDAVLAEVGEDLRRWGAVLRDRGVAAMLEVASVRHGLVRRVLGTLGGERLLTDVRHVGQVLHAEAAAQRLGAVALTEWLRLRIVESENRRGEARPERTRRLESDADAVQILTVHKCKGLEFPVVYVPFGWDRWVPGEPREVLHHDDAGRRIRAVGGPGDPEWAEHCRAQRAEDDGEDLRLLYVALTRAQGQVVAWWTPSSQTASSALNRVLRTRDRAPGLEPDPFVTITDDTTVWDELVAYAGPHLAVESVAAREALPYVPAAGEHGRLDVARFARELDLAWRRSSYSSLTAEAHGAGLPEPATSEPEESTVTDEADLEVDPAPDTAALPSPMADLPFGAAFGVLVHSVLETVDTAAGDLGAALVEAAAEQLARRPLAGVTATALADALDPVVRTPVDAAGWAYADIAPRDRLAELDFELPLAGGDHPVTREAVTLGRAAALLREHLPADDPLVSYPEALEALSGQVLRGYLTGSIDAVLRAPDGRFVIVDHKTNWLGPMPVDGADAEPLTSAHYGPAQMTAAMIGAHYPLQALLYGVALHRFLRWRLPGYDPATHLGGVAYLFLRGMCGPDTPVVDGTTCGVFRWSPPPALLVALSDLLAGEDTVTLLPDLASEDGVRFAVRATGLLAEFGARGVLAPADVAVARRLGRLGGEPDEQVLLAAALTVRALRSGSVCLDLSDVDRRVLGEDDALVATDDLAWPEPAAWEAALAASPLTKAGGPLRLDDGLLWLDRYRRQEDQVRDDLTARAVAPPPAVDHARLRAALDRLFGDVGADDHQRLACAVATLRWTAVVAGGPGTGKTTTVARLLAVLRDQDPTLRIALAAPTGKAAARLGEAIGEERLPEADRERVGTPEASTIHRLLGSRPDSTSRFRHDRNRRLPFDVVVVDETSMVSLTLMARLLEAVRDDARVVLVGDPDQLASVEAGAVLGDLVSAPDLASGDGDATLDVALDEAGCTARPGANGVVRLDRNYRNNADIAALAAAIRVGDAEKTLECLRTAPSLDFVESVDLTQREPAGLVAMREEVVTGTREVADAARRGEAETALEKAEEHRLLCAHRRGSYGVSRWARQVERWLAEDGGVDPDLEAGAEWWPGRPLLVTRNDRDAGLYNGDTGVAVERAGRLVAVFSRGGRALERAPALLGSVETVHAMTVHRAQGSQYARVSVLLPPPESPLLTRELLYTAVTRARTRVRVVGSAEAVRAAVERPVSRASGFARRSTAPGR